MHQPDGRREREEDGSILCTCRHCRKQIRSREGKVWNLAEGLDLDALAASCMSSHFSVVDAADGVVIARYPLPEGSDEEAIEALRDRLCAQHGIEPGGDLEVRLVSHAAILGKRH
ncbi:hypothetical protein [Novosphingobium sp. PhB165]|uniref:hypothetical protein n=1 Tax=Novosphingobium sp. PhB165 TaxID=2485105 RepID=UPI001FB2D5B6|nr:hypothetical protein [Novosphingobium sp. PhB165]